MRKLRTGMMLACSAFQENYGGTIKHIFRRKGWKLRKNTNLRCTSSFPRSFFIFEVTGERTSFHSAHTLRSIASEHLRETEEEDILKTRGNETIRRSLPNFPFIQQQCMHLPCMAREHGKRIEASKKGELPSSALSQILRNIRKSIRTGKKLQ